MAENPPPTKIRWAMCWLDANVDEVWRSRRYLHGKMYVNESETREWRVPADQDDELREEDHYISLAEVISKACQERADTNG